MKRKHSFVMKVCVLLLVAFCLVNCSSSSLTGGTVIITNNSSESFSGKIWTDSKELFNGTIRSWNSKSFYISDDCNVYTDFESDNGEKYNPSGHVSGGRSLILDL